MIIRAINSWMLIWKPGLSRDAACQSGRHLKTGLEILPCTSRRKQSPPMEMLQEYDWPTKWWHLGMRILIGRCHINLVEDSRSWQRCRISLPAEYLIRTKMCGFHAAQRMRSIEERDLSCHMCMWVNRDRHIWRWMERWYPKGEFWARWRIFTRILVRSWTWWEDLVLHYDDYRRARIEDLL